MRLEVFKGARMYCSAFWVIHSGEMVKITNVSENPTTSSPCVQLTKNSVCELLYKCYLIPTDVSTWRL